MILLLRIVLTALGLIVTNLVFFDFQPGGRWLILLEAVLTGFFTRAISVLAGNVRDWRLRSLFNAGGVLLSLALTGLIFSGIKLSIPGVVVLYLGLAAVERGILQLQIEDAVKS